MLQGHCKAACSTVQGAVLMCVQRHNEDKLNEAFRTAAGVFLVFSVNMSGHFQGYARMASAVSRQQVCLSICCACSTLSLSAHIDRPIFVWLCMALRVKCINGLWALLVAKKPLAEALCYCVTKVRSAMPRHESALSAVPACLLRPKVWSGAEP